MNLGATGQQSKLSRQSNQIVGASVGSGNGESNTGIKSVTDNKSPLGKSSSIAPSEEFRNFWGSNVEPAWFEGQKFVSPFVIFVVLLTFLTLYLSSRLLFSPGEFEQIFFENSSSKIEEIATPLNSKEDESLIYQGSTTVVNKQTTESTTNKPVAKESENTTEKKIKKTR
jgi:hypothetical protein